MWLEQLERSHGGFDTGYGGGDGERDLLLRQHHSRRDHGRVMAHRQSSPLVRGFATVNLRKAAMAQDLSYGGVHPDAPTG